VPASGDVLVQRRIFGRPGRLVSRRNTCNLFQNIGAIDGQVAIIDKKRTYKLL
jgi:hypothetical protein